MYPKNGPCPKISNTQPLVSQNRICRSIQFGNAAWRCKTSFGKSALRNQKFYVGWVTGQGHVVLLRSGKRESILSIVAVGIRWSSRSDETYIYTILAGAIVRGASQSRGARHCVYYPSFGQQRLISSHYTTCCVMKLFFWDQTKSNFTR